MPVAGRKPKPDGLKRNNHKPTHDWTEVPDVPFRGIKLPAKWIDGQVWPARTKQWWAALSTMPHCVLWTPADWQFALDTAHVHATFATGELRVAAELRNREKILGNTLDARRDLRIRYVTPSDDREEASGVTSIDDYRAALG